MKTSPRRRPASLAAFTLIELLVVIAIIGILAAMLMSSLVSAKTHAKVVMSKTEMGKIATAIHDYETTYNRFPISADAANAAAATGDDFTFGGTFRRRDGTPYSVEALGNYRRTTLK